MLNDKFNRIHPSAQLGANVTVESFTTIYENVEIGENTWIGPNVVIFPDTKIGKNCTIYPGAVLGAVSQDLKYKGEKASVEIGDNTVIRECVTIHKATADKLVTRVGDHCLLMAYTHVAHDVQIGNHCIIANGAGIAGHVEIGDYVTIEGMVGIQQFVKIGDYAFIGACSNLRKDVPPFIRASRTKEEFCVFIGVNTIGLKRRGFADTAIQQIEQMYKILYIHNKNFSLGQEEIEKNITDSIYKQQILDFIRNAKSGIVKGII